MHMLARQSEKGMEPIKRGTPVATGGAAHLDVKLTQISGGYNEITVYGLRALRATTARRFYFYFSTLRQMYWLRITYEA